MRGRTKEKSACRKSVTCRVTDRRKGIIKGRALMRGLTVTDLAKRCGLAPSTLYRKLQHPGDISLAELELLDELINFTDDEILYFVRWRRCEQ